MGCSSSVMLDRVCAGSHISCPGVEEDIRHCDTVCLSFTVLQTHGSDFLGRAVCSHVSHSADETRRCSICAKSARTDLLRGVHLQPGSRTAGVIPQNAS